MKKIICQNCKSKKLKTITGMSIGNPLKNTQTNFILKECIKCGYYIATQTKIIKGKKVETLLKSKSVEMTITPEGNIIYGNESEY